MRVLLLRANPRKTGYTQRLADLFLQGLQAEGAQVTDVDLTALNLVPCIGCYHCWIATPGSCVHHDDMAGLLEQVVTCDVLVCATPVYFYSMSSCLKVFFERVFPLAAPGLVRSRGGLTRNRLRYPDLWHGKKMITLITGALAELEAYRPLNETFRLIADSLDFELGGQLTRPEASLLDYPFSKPKTLKRIETAFVQAGREAALTGRLSPQTVASAALPLVAEPELFRTYSNIYWERAVELGAAALTPSQVQQRVGSDVRILMREMVRCFDPQAAARVSAVLLFEFTDQGLILQITLANGQAALTEGAHANPDLRVRCAARVWAELFTRQLDVREALKNRQLVLTGDKSLFARLDRWFPPPSA